MGQLVSFVFLFLSLSPCCRAVLLPQVAPSSIRLEEAWLPWTAWAGRQRRNHLFGDLAGSNVLDWVTSPSLNLTYWHRQSTSCIWKIILYFKLELKTLKANLCWLEHPKIPVSLLLFQVGSSCPCLLLSSSMEKGHLLLQIPLQTETTKPQVAASMPFSTDAYWPNWQAAGPGCPGHLLLRPRTASSWLLPCREHGWWPKHWIPSFHQLHFLHCRRFEAVSEQRCGTEAPRPSLMFPSEPYQNEWHAPAENLPSLRFLVTHFLLFSPSLRNWDRLKLPTHYGKNIRFYKPRKESQGEQVQGGGGRDKYVTLSLFFLLLFFLSTIPWFSTWCLVYQHYFCLFIILWSVPMLVMATTSEQTYDEIKIKRREKRWEKSLLSWSDFHTDLQK